MHLDKPKREGEETLLYAFDARVAWVAACHHRTSSRISWTASSRPCLEPLFAGLLPVLSSDDRLPDGKHLRFSVEVRFIVRLRSVAAPRASWRRSKNALVEALASRGVASDVDGDADVVFVARRAGTPDARRTVVGIDVGGGARHRRGARVAAWTRAAARDARGAVDYAVALGRAYRAARRSDGWKRHDSDRGGWLRGGRCHSSPGGFPAAPFSPRSGVCRNETPDLFPGTVATIVASMRRRGRIATMVGNLRAAAWTGAAYEPSIVIAQQDVRGLTPDDIERLLPAGRTMQPGVFCFNPPYGRAHRRKHGEEELLALYADMGRALGASAVGARRVSS